MKPIQLISPVDGSVYAERVPLTPDAAKAAVARARAAQKGWAARPLEERIALVKAGVAKLNEMAPVIVEELAWQMGRPTRFGGEFGGVNARTEYMSQIAAETLAPKVVEDSDKFRRYLAREALGVVFIVAPWNYPYLTTINTLVPALIAGNTVVLKHASQTLLVGGLFYGLNFGLGGVAGAILGVLADRYGIEMVYQICAFLPLAGLMAWFLPRIDDGTGPR